MTLGPACTDYVRSSVMWTQRNLKLLTLSAADSFIVRRVCVLDCLAYSLGNVGDCCVISKSDDSESTTGGKSDDTHPCGVARIKG